MPQLESHFRIGLQLESHFTVGGCMTALAQRAQLEAHFRIGALQATLAVSPVIVAQAITARQPLATTLLMGGTVIVGGGSSDGGTPEQLQKHAEEIADNVFLVGDAAIGKADADTAWRIRKITIGANDSVTTQYARGSTDFTSAWENRADYEYL